MTKIYNTKSTKYKLKHLCEKHHVNYGALADHLGVHLQTVSNWANYEPNDIRSIPGDFLIKIAFYFKTTVEKLHNEAHYKTLKVTAA